MALPPRPQRGMAEGKRVEERPHRYPDGAEEHGALARREYGLLVPEEPESNPNSAEPQGSGYRPEGTSETGRTDRR